MTGFSIGGLREGVLGLGGGLGDLIQAFERAEQSVPDRLGRMSQLRLGTGPS